MNPRKKLRDQQDAGKREVHDEDQIPRRARPGERRPHHRAEGGDEIKQNVTEYADAVKNG